jgi:hypothetical protein
VISAVTPKTARNVAAALVKAARRLERRRTRR